MCTAKNSHLQEKIVEQTQGCFGQVDSAGTKEVFQQPPLLKIRDFRGFPFPHERDFISLIERDGQMESSVTKISLNPFVSLFTRLVASDS